jgi:hypothetical protein
MICAYSLSVDDDGSYMLGDETEPAEIYPGFHDWHFLHNGAPHPATCPVCDRRTDPQFINPRFRVSRRKWDAVVTGDGYYLVSSVFRAVAREYGWIDVEFAELPGDSDYFWLRPSRTIAFDAERRATRFEHRCPACKGWVEVVGAHPIMLRGVDRPLAAGIFQTDIEFGSGHGQCPLIVVGMETAAQIKAAGLRHVDLAPVSSTP